MSFSLFAHHEQLWRPWDKLKELNADGKPGPELSVRVDVRGTVFQRSCVERQICHLHEDLWQWDTANCLELFEPKALVILSPFVLCLSSHKGCRFGIRVSMNSGGALEDIMLWELFRRDCTS